MDLNQVILSIQQLKAEQEMRRVQKWHRLPHRMLNAEQADALFSARPGDQKLRITYVMSHVRVCGGAKIILEHANQLVSRGHEVFIVCPDPFPEWMEVKAQYIQTSRQTRISDALPDTDVIVCTVIDQVSECFLSKKAPVLMFEQGDTYIYEFDRQSTPAQQFFQDRWGLPIPVLAVSKGLANALEQNFKRRPQLLPNALNDRIFYPRSAHASGNERPKIMFVGAEQAEFKGIADVLAALDLVRQAGWEFEPVWVTPIQPRLSFAGTLAVNPTQEQLGSLYRECDIYVSGSRFESFPLPPLEAMTSGCAVVSTRNVGILEYGVEGVNCLMSDIRDPKGLADAIIRMLENPELRRNCVEGGYQTASRYQWDAVMAQLETYFYGLIELWQEQVYPLRPKVERLPKGMSALEAQHRIHQTIVSMEEEWCLWMVEGEELSEAGLEQVGRLLAEAADDVYALSVQYPDDIANHSLVRTECRLMRKGSVIPNDLFKADVLPVMIQGGSEGYFLPAWLGVSRQLYQAGEYGKIIQRIQLEYGQAAFAEQALMIKWLVLALIEMQTFAPANQLLGDAIETHVLNTDLQYLYGIVSNQLSNPEFGQSMFRLAAFLGEARLYPEWFVNIAGRSFS
ncbi:MAG: glycosyltransferase family 4 protein [Tumebacillaceae bacterium]